MLLIMCEGPNEKAIIDMLLEADCLKFSRDDLLGLNPYHARQIGKSGMVMGELNQYSGKVTVIRVGDTLTDKLTIPRDYKDQIEKEYKVCTKPEIEMLLIIAEGMESEFNKVKAGKNRMSAKNFCKSNLVFNKKRYDNSTQFYRDYFAGRIDDLVTAIKRYKQLQGSHAKDEHYLADLLKGS